MPMKSVPVLSTASLVLIGLAACVWFSPTQISDPSSISEELSLVATQTTLAIVPMQSPLFPSHMPSPTHTQVTPVAANTSVMDPKNWTDS